MSGDLLVSGSKDNVARVWGMRTIGTCFSEFVHPQWVGPVAFTRCAGGALATGSDDGVVRVWSTDTAMATDAHRAAMVELRGESNSWIAGVGWAEPCGAQADDEALPPLLSCSRDGEVVLWDVGTQASLAREYTPPVRAPGLRSSTMVTAFDSLHRQAVLARTGQGPRHMLSSDEEIAVFAFGENGSALRQSHLLAPRKGDVDRGPVLSLGLDRGDGNNAGAGACTGFASGSNWGTVHLWDLRSGESTATLENGCPGGIRSLALCGHLLIAGREPGPLLNVWDLRVRRIVQRLRGHTNNDALALFLDAGRGRLACGGRMNELRVWDFLAASAG